VSRTDRSREFRDDVNGAVFLELKRHELKSFSDLKHEYTILTIPVSRTKSFEVELYRVDILSDNFEAKTSSNEVVKSSGLFYRGIVKGRPNSLVAFSFFESHIRGLITDENGNYVLGQSKSEKDSYILYNDKELKVQHNFTCNVNTDIKPDKSEENYQERNTNGCIDIYVEVSLFIY